MQGRRPSDRGIKKDKHLINEAITSSEVRLIGVEGEQLGVLVTSRARELAEEAGVDLVAVAPEAKPPVCKLIDYGKLKYREQKKAAEARKRAATNTVKELRIRYSTDQHDFDTKVRKARAFLEGGDRVRFQMRFRGREVVYRELGEETLQKVVDILEDIASVEERTPLVGNRMILTLVPRAAVPAAAAAKPENS